MYVKKKIFFYHMEKNIEKMSRRVQQAAAYIKEKHVHKERKKKYALFDFGKMYLQCIFG